MPSPVNESEATAFFTIALDPETAMRLMYLAKVCNNQPQSLMAAIIHDVLLDDELAHSTEPSSLQ
jgi:predicted transcriptional regulator